MNDVVRFDQSRLPAESVRPTSVPFLTHERIFDAAVSDDRKIDADGRCKAPVGDTVDVKNATYSNSIGDPVLGAYWQDPEFDPGQRAFYYVRVIEIPAPTWVAYDEKFFGSKAAKHIKRKQQERAYTSPVWYTPAGCARHLSRGLAGPAFFGI